MIFFILIDQNGRTGGDVCFLMYDKFDNLLVNVSSTYKEIEVCYVDIIFDNIFQRYICAHCPPKCYIDYLNKACICIKSLFFVNCMRHFRSMINIS